MSAFIVAFFTIYSCMHALIFMRVRNFFPGRLVPQLLIGLLFALMIGAPVATRLLERAGHVASARVCAIVGYTWLGLVFLAFCAFLLVGAIELLWRAWAWLSGSLGPDPAFSRWVTLTMAAIVVCVGIYGYFEASMIRVENVTILTKKLPPGVDLVRIAQISDLHLGLILRGSRLEAVMEKVRQSDPDILVSTGDLIDGEFGSEDALKRIFDSVQPRLGKFAVTGNHEVYAGLEKSVLTTERFGFRVLRGSAQNVGGVLTIAGLDDTTDQEAGGEQSLLSGLHDDRNFVLLLKHRPDPLLESMGRFDLQLSGHTHKGQIFPFSLITRKVYKRQAGLYKLKKGSYLYTSRGTGTWGPPMRVLSPPEVTILDIRRSG